MDGLTDLQKQIIKAVEAQLPLVRTLPNPYKSKCLMCLSYEYLILDMEEKAIPLLKEADPKYFGDQLAEDMKEDPTITLIVMAISAKLEELGIIKVKI